MSTEEKHIILTFVASPDEEDLLSGYMLTRFTLGGIEETDAGEIRMYIPEAEWTREAQENLTVFLESDSEIALLNIEELDSKRNWNAEWEAGIEPQFVTDSLVITPSWKRAEVESTREHVIVIDPKMSFGTGHHETTRLCLRAIEEIDVNDKRVLDLGTGSGILGIYTLQRSAAHVLGIDTDEWAAENVRENLGLNNISEQQFRIEQGTLDSVVPSDEKFDIIIANIHRNILLELASDLLRHLMPAGVLLLSGLLTIDSEEVTSAYSELGFLLSKTYSEGDWTALLFHTTE